MKRLISPTFWYHILRHPIVRLPILLLLHLVLFTSIYAFSFGMRFDFAVPPRMQDLLLATAPYVVLAKLLTFYFSGHFHGWWRYVTFADLTGLLRASFLSMIAVIILDYAVLDFSSRIPRIVILLDTVLTFLCIASLRSLWRMVDEQISPVINRKKYRSALLVGSDHLAGQLAAQINSQQALDLRVKAMLAKGEYRRKARLGHIPIAGRVDDVERIAKRHHASTVLVPSGLLAGADLRQLVDRCIAAGLELRILPRLEDALQGSEQIPLRPLAINDLLRRDPVALDDAGIGDLLRGRRVLVTGAGGSIGSEICRQVLRYQPAEIVLLGRGENRIFAINGELSAVAGQTRIVPAIGDVTDGPRMERLFEEARPEIVFHAAAHKHVPLMEQHPGEAVKNNVLGTRTVAELADRHGVGHFVLISTDKAVNPTSVMGCSKQLAERVVHSYSQHSKTKYAVVRFGNVLGSAGSVIPTFQEQIRRGGPITITDRRMTRYFMSIPEASQLVLQSAAMCRGGEIFVLDMGEPVKIVELAEDLVSLSGLPAGSIEFEFVGTRPGEKLYEELYFDEEQTLPTAHEKVRAAYHREFHDETFRESLEGLEAMVDGRGDLLRSELRRLIPDYQDVEKEHASRASTNGKPVREIEKEFAFDSEDSGDWLPSQMPAK